MKAVSNFVAGIGALASLTLCAAEPASALSSKECSTKYKAAKDAGTLGGKSWNDFRKAECGSDDKPAEKAAAKDKASDKPATPKITGGGGVVYPTSVSPKFSSETAFKQRLHTCSQQYQANKATGGNGNLRWIQKGGGYWPQCNARLKKS